MSKIKDTDYLGLSARIHAMEGKLVTRERLDRMLEARTPEDAVKVLSECGYGETAHLTLDGVEALLSARRTAALADLEGSLPDPRLLDVFKVSNDYHNLKVLLKAEALEKNFDRLLVETGRVPSRTMKEAVSGASVTLPKPLAAALEEGRRVLAETGDPQRLDMALDRAYFADMAGLARETGSRYLMGYVELQVDGANLRCLVRALRMKKTAGFLKGVLFPGGTVGSQGILAVAAANGAGLAELYAPTRLKEAAELGAAAVKGGQLTAFERACDNALTAYLAGAKSVPFGDAPVIGYLAALEGELTNLRILLSGRLADLDKEIILERLRECYA